jgi:hypothetical protein
MLTTMLTQLVTVTTRTTGAVDDYGNPTSSWGAPVTYRARLEHNDSLESNGDQLVVATRYRLILPPSAVIGAGDRVTDEDGITYEVDGPPLKQRTPRGVHHIDARLTLTEAL